MEFHDQSFWMKKQISRKMMNKTALYIIAPIVNKNHEANGYLNVLKELGWHTLQFNPQSKAEVKDLIVNDNLRLIFAPSKYGVRHLPIDMINEYGVCVVIKPLLFIKDDTDLWNLARIKNLLIESPVHPSATEEYFPKWYDTGLEPVHILPAMDLQLSVPESLNKTIDIIITVKYVDKELTGWINTIVERAIINNFTISVVDLTKTDLPSIVNAMGQSKIVCNLHDRICRLQLKIIDQFDLLAMFCGSSLITNNTAVAQIFKNDVVFTKTVTQTIRHIEQALVNYELPTEDLLRISTLVAYEHSYFNRLMQIFHHFGHLEYIDTLETISGRFCIKRTWEMQAKLENQELAYG